jgi:OPT oligopeptide transporter protein
MKRATVLLAILLSVIATAIMSYVSMAAPIGPWIAPTLVLIALFLYGVARKPVDTQQVALAVASGSIGGIIATAVGFYMPTLFFADRLLFAEWLAHPWFFAALISLIVGIAGWFGIWCALLAESQFIDEQHLSFPISHLVHGMIVAHAQVRKMYELVAGFFSTLCFCILQDGFFGSTTFIPKSLSLLARTAVGPFVIPAVRFDLWPMVWAIGFITGHLIAVPLAVGALATMFLIAPINAYWFKSVASMDFILAFCSGIVVITTIEGMWGSLRKFVKIRASTTNGMHRMMCSMYAHKRFLKEGICIAAAIVMMCMYCGLSIIAAIYIVIFTAMCTYQMMGIAGKIGIAPLGRFATFVMVPAMLLFTRDVWHLTLISVFVSACGGVAVDVLFGRMLGRLCNVEPKIMERYQYLGLLIGSLVVGGIFVIVVQHIPLGSAELFAHKAQTRALLFNCNQFNWSVVVLGGLFGLVVQWFNCNPIFVLGGILMPLNLSLGLIFGGFLAYCSAHKDRYEAFWSGVFASNSLWMVIRAFLS